ncbi:Tripartite motif-containing protein 2 [Holothuria leucospilota]|uniref:Tripartite motif-containing protein 2 n=1 Tax=Holothuria leucospilota TaxID=206669 RepID=A0A9Q1CKX2_HOLLE|nr:Tripartite motif-containing protein 2 [Holothuria leucospilota]
MSTQLSKLTCPLCYDRFKTPKMLLCGHTFCQPCAHQLFQSTPISCPVCRVQVSTPYSSVDQLPTNYVLKALIDSDASLFDKESVSRSFGECPTHPDICDQFCRTCEKQVCKQCISDNHPESSHDTSPVGAVVVQQREVLDNLIIELRDLIKRLESISSNITESEKTCQSEADQLDKDINASVSECTDNIAAHGESLQVVVQEDKKKILKYLDDLKVKNSEIFLSASYVLDQCQSLQADLDKDNLSRIAVIKRLTENRRKIKKDLEKLEGKENVLHIGLKFQSLTTEAKAGNIARKTSLIPKAIPMETISFEDEEWSRTDRNLAICKRSDLKSRTKPKASKIKKKSPSTSSGFSFGSTQSFTFGAPTPAIAHDQSPVQSDSESETDASLLEFLWPTPTWMIAVRVETAGLHSFVKFTNLHFLRETFYHEIGVDQEWSYASHSDYEGKFILCFCPGKVHKFSLPSNQNLKEPGKIVSTVFTPKDVLGISWDKVHRGCYALLNDGKTLLHLEFRGPEVFKEIAVFDEEITSNGDTHFFHVNEEGSMAICDHKKKEVYFFEKIEAEPTLTVTAPPDLQNATPTCVNTRRGEKLWMRKVEKKYPGK